MVLIRGEDGCFYELTARKHVSLSNFSNMVRKDNNGEWHLDGMFVDEVRLTSPTTFQAHILAK